MSRGTFHIIIINDSSQPKCDFGCGVDWSSAEAWTLAQQQIKNKFGERTQLQYLDLAKDTTSHVATEWSQIIKGKNLLLPILLINGQLRVSGEFDLRQLTDAVEAEMEMEIET